jgi:hypothetical protein
LLPILFGTACGDVALIFVALDFLLSVTAPAGLAALILLVLLAIDILIALLVLVTVHVLTALSAALAAAFTASLVHAALVLLSHLLSPHFGPNNGPNQNGRRRRYDPAFTKKLIEITTIEFGPSYFDRAINEETFWQQSGAAGATPRRDAADLPLVRATRLSNKYRWRLRC